MQEIYAMQQDSRSVTEFYYDLKILWEELEIYILILTCSCRIKCSCQAMHNARKNHTTLYVILFLTSLNQNYVVVESQILFMDHLPPMNKIFSMVLQHEKQGYFHVSEGPTSLVNDADSQRFKGKSCGSYSFGKGNNRVCTHCGKTNHTNDNCYAKHGFPPHMHRKFANHSSTNDQEIDIASQVPDAKSASPSITFKQYDQLMRFL